MVSTPNTKTGLRWMYHSDAIHVSAEVTRVQKPMVKSKLTRMMRTWMAIIAVGSVMWNQSDQAGWPTAYARRGSIPECLAM